MRGRHPLGVERRLDVEHVHRTMPDQPDRRSVSGSVPSSRCWAAAHGRP
ncbi:hypothetical protein Ae168Ps1_4643c [Pseudonocardia sp. Ae168_Ps1]|nr:hypothetical protein Ae150APs1_4616c [Pseudonocardia sp. Ae150A_Ps1]OLL82237.1 hypothetical protein Ae168Ps1_4643c [Pseudonocardia sp. Ae168_Ps1]OLL83647.1 hypothetical protein Ae263Ps1_0702 [Pseudonocardia sp. Ae263_Ps1]OLL90313.1 hypothetical protein Ae356Ps1_0210c [Pseudonocardia sp. Ae356_Ps1]